MLELKPVNVRDFNISFDDHGTNIPVLEIKVPEGYIEYTWNPNLDEHEVLSGNRLKNGMVVILADSMMRRNPENISDMNEYDLRHLNEDSRWSIVTDIEMSDEGVVKFNSVYADGSIIPRSYHKAYRWAVIKKLQIMTACPSCGEDHGTDPAQVSLTSLADILMGIVRPDLRVDPMVSLKHAFTFDPEHGGFFGNLVESLYPNIKFDPNFLMERNFGKNHGDLNPENSAAGETDEKPPVSPTNFERRLRDADSRSKVRQILIERDKFFGDRLEAKQKAESEGDLAVSELKEKLNETIDSLEVNASDDVDYNNPERMMYVWAAGLHIGDVLFIAGTPYKVNGLNQLPGFDYEINVDLLKVGSMAPMSLNFRNVDRLNIARS